MNQAWRPIETFWTGSDDSRIAPLLRLFLSSDGSVVRSLKSLFLQTIEIELVRQEQIAIEKKVSEALEVTPGEKGIERTVWLNREEEGKTHHLIYAVTAFPVSRLKPNLLQALQLGEKPLGQILEEGQLSTYRDHLEVTYLPFPSVAQGFSLPEDTLFWARRYRLWINGVISAFILEVFSPEFSSIRS
ncbi:hypothetical protein MNBD_NITROSPIRAE01-751 [hydrothermal vent metagenome]|uniref:Chorismate lyase n=1 Tax=hydrothermal vent metagenome TaxID=652676 RepID=A0A3B1DFM5_9ZZZZ